MSQKEKNCEQMTCDCPPFSHPQKESEWSTEKTYSECFFDECAMTQKLSPEQCQYAIDYFSKFMSSAIATAVSQREKEIAEEVERLRLNCPCGKFNCHGKGNDDALDAVLQIIKH